MRSVRDIQSMSIGTRTGRWVYGCIVGGGGKGGIVWIWHVSPLKLDI